MSAVVEPHRFNVEQYYRMAETGILPPDARVELIDGEIVDRAPIGVPHSAVTARLNQVLTLRLAAAAMIRCQLPIRLSAFAEPQPDIAVLRYRENFYGDAHPGSADVLWLVEVAESSLAFDRGAKLALYARHGVAEVWIVNLPERRLELYAEPRDGAYQQQRIVLPGDHFSGCTSEHRWSTQELLGWSAAEA